MIKGGYILQPRSFDGSDASKMSPVTREVWFYVLRNVNHTDNGKYKRGQSFFSLSDIQEDLSWYVGYRKMRYSKPQLTKALRRLCEGLMLETAKATRGVYITVCNYDEYQNPKSYEGNDEGSTKVQRKTPTGHTKNKNVKNERMKEEKDSNREKFNPTSIRPEWFPEKDWNDLILHRKKHPKKPTETERAYKGLINQFSAAVEKGFTVSQCVDTMTSRNWTGFNADWMKSDEIKNKLNGGGYVEPGKTKNYRE